MLKKYLKQILAIISLLFWAPEVALTAPIVYNWDLLVTSPQNTKIKTTDTGPVLLFSDSPEMVNKPGIMYKDKINGDTRLFFHHVNDTKTLKKFSIVLYNPELKPVNITINRRGVSKPSFDWLKAGQDVQVEYFAKYKPKNITIEPFSHIELLSEKSGVNFKPQQLITGMMDLHTTSNVEVTFLMSVPGSNIFADADILPQLPADQTPPLRGTFKNANRNVQVINQYNGNNQQLVTLLADGVEDKFVWGVDAPTGKPAHNYGNYGIVYNVSYQTSGNIPYLFGFNTLGGYFAGVGLLKQQENEQLVMLPPRGLSMGATEKETLLFEMSAEDSKGSFIFSPPGSANLPIRLLFKNTQYKNK